LDSGLVIAVREFIDTQHTVKVRRRALGTGAVSPLRSQ
jgi:hypothetical protein